MKRIHSPTQGGVALIVVLLLLVVATVVAVSGVRFGSQQLLIAANDELRLSASQAAQSAIDATITNGAYTEGNNSGPVACTTNAPTGTDSSGTAFSTSCGGSLVTISSLPSSYLDADLQAGRLRIAVERLGTGNGACQRGMRATSMVNFACAQYAVLSQYTPANGGATSSVQQGRAIPELTTGGAGQ